MTECCFLLEEPKLLWSLSSCRVYGRSHVILTAMRTRETRKLSLALSGTIFTR